MSLDAAVDAVLAAAGADAAEAFAQDIHVRERRWANGELAEERLRHESGLAVRVRRRGRVGLAATSGRFDVADVMRRARTAAVVGPGYPSRFAGGAAALVTPNEDEDRHPGPPDEAAVVRLAARLRERHRDISSTIAVIETRETRRIRSTEGVDEHDGRSFVMVRVTVSRSDNGEVLDLAFEAPCDVAGTTLDAALAQLDDRLRWTGRAAIAGNRDLPVVLTPRALAALVVEPLGEALSGPALVEGTSFLLDYAPTDSAGPGLTLLDDPALTGAPRSRRVDDEGMPTIRRELLRHGAVVGRALDLGSGERLGSPSTGSAWRGWDAWPTAAPSTLVVPEGDVPLRALLARWPRAILVDDVSGEWFTDAGASGVTASASLAFLVEGGEVVGRLRDIALSADREGLIRGDLTVSREVEWVGDRAVLPYAHAAGLSVVNADG